MNIYFVHDRRLKYINLFLMVFRVGLGLIFFYSSIEKIMHPYGFLATVYDFELTGPLIGLVVALFLPWLELFLAFSLIFGVFLSGALLGSWLLCIIFLAIQASAIWRGLSVNCGCFGPDDQKMVGLFTFLRTSVLFSIAFVVWFFQLFLSKHFWYLSSGKNNLCGQMALADSGNDIPSTSV